MAFAIVCAGLAWAPTREIAMEHTGQYLARFDPDGGPAATPLIEWTLDKGAALRFDHLADALSCWKRQSARVPTKPDGEPNRPLSAYSVTFEEI